MGRTILPASSRVKRGAAHVGAMDDALPPLGALVRRADPDRYFTTLFAPAGRREALWTLYAFNHEAARAQEAARQPIASLIRLQWWREVVEGARKMHEVATPLADLLEAGLVERALLLSVLDAREETEFATVAEWRAWLLAGAGGLAVAAAQALGAGVSAESVRAAGAGYGVAGVLRNTAALARAGLCLLPGDVLAAHGLSVEAVTGGADAAALQRVFAALAEQGREMLGPAVRRGAALAAVLPAVLARRDLRRPGVVAERGLGDRLAVVAAAVAGRG